MLQTSQLLQSIVGRASLQSPTPVEFIPGQVFRGTVQKLFPDNLALVQIGGMPVMARLVASLEAGQRAWLQVQPSSGMVTLKVLTETERPLQAQSPTIDGLMKSLGIPESKESQGIVQALVKENAPITQEIVSSFETVAKALSPSAATTEAFVLAMKRGLPLTKDVVGAVKAFLSNQTLGTAIQAVNQELDSFLAATQPQAKGTTPVSTQQIQTPGVRNTEISQSVEYGTTDLRQTAHQLKEKLGMLTALVAQLTQGETNANESSSHLQRSAAAPSISQQPQFPQEAVTHEWQTLGANGQQMQKTSNGETGISDPTHRILLQHIRQTVSSEETEPLRSGSHSITPRENENLGQSDAASLSPSFSDKANPLKEMFRHMGMMHERQLLQQGLTGRVDTEQSDHLQNVKSLVMQLAQSTAQNVPHGLKEAAENLLQQITGQQLMMIQPPNQALAQIVMQVPLRTENGDENAFIQIESRKKDGGQLDSDNCRLLFNLDMEQLGLTMVDVSIVNRIVNIQVFNNMPWLEPLLSSSRESLSAEMRELGYQLSNLRAQPMPDSSKLVAPANGLSARNTMRNEYKGMDIRV